MSYPIGGTNNGSQVDTTSNTGPAQVRSDDTEVRTEGAGNFSANTDVTLDRAAQNMENLQNLGQDHGSIDAPAFHIGSNAATMLHNRFMDIDVPNFALMFDRISNNLLESASERRLNAAKAAATMRDDQLQMSKDQADLTRKDGETQFMIDVVADSTSIVSQAAIARSAVTAPTDPVSQARTTATTQAKTAAAGGVSDAIKSFGHLLHSKVEAEQAEIQGRMKQDSSIEQQMHSSVQNNTAVITDVLSKQANLSEGLEQAHRQVFRG